MDRTMVKIDTSRREYEKMREILRTIEEYNKLKQQALNYEHYRNLCDLEEKEIYSILIEK